jgi:SPP1 family predicted phage head-tail adaptor
MPPIGSLRHRLIIEAPSEQPDGAGGVVRTWTVLGTVWAALEPLAADDVLLADKRVGLVTHRVRLRHRADLSLGHRFRLGARVLVIRALRDPEERGAVIECLVAEEQ